MASELMEVMYEELRRLAGGFFRRQPAAHILQPTALVHEAFLKVSSRTGVQFDDRAQFAAVCASTMRGILADHARSRRALKRGGDRKRVTLADVEASAPGKGIDALRLDEVLTILAERSQRQARIVEYRFFSGMSVDEIAHVLGISRSTVEGEWRMARAWLTVQLERNGST